MTDIPKIAFPVRFSNGRMVANEQDSDAEIAGCIETNLRTLKGQRIERPDFGMNDLVMSEISGAVAPDYYSDIIAQEPRANVYVEEDRTEIDDLALSVRVSMQEEVDNG